MCHFISVTLPAGSDVTALAALMPAFRLKLAPYLNASLRGQLRVGEILASTTTGACDCGTALGGGARHETPPHTGGAVDPNVARLTKKGWSPGKIERWLEQQRQVAARDERADAERRVARGESGSDDLTRWQSAIEALLDGGAAWVGLLLHTYRGGLDERIALRGEVEVARADLGPDVLLGIEEDTIVRVVARPRG